MKRQLEHKQASIKVLDPEETLVYRADVKTSEFGIASTDWLIPDNLRLETYRIQMDFEEGQYKESIQTFTNVKIKQIRTSPTFVVIAKPDQAYYLPDQNASVEVRADYLFGELRAARPCPHCARD